MTVTSDTQPQASVGTDHTLKALRVGLDRGDFSAVELTQHYLQEIDTTAESVSAFVEVYRDDALAQAAESDERRRSGSVASPIDGIPFAIKDIISVRGKRMSAGSGALDYIPATDAEAIVQLRDAGGIGLGSTRMHELAYGPSGINDFDGGARNPRYPAGIPGGSSSGSAAAVAAGISPIAFGSDTGGSIRAPASLCGVVGFKPSYDLLSTEGVRRTAPSLDHLGFLANSVEDVRIVMNVFADIPLAPVPAGARRKIAIYDDPEASADAARGAAFLSVVDALGRAGWIVERVSAPDFDVMEISTAIMAYEAYQVNRELLEKTPELLGADVRERLEAGSRQSRISYEDALSERARLRAEVDTLAAPYDALVNVSIPIRTPTVEEGARADIRRLLMRNTRLQNLTGAPAISIPAGEDPAPWGIQLFGVQGQDAKLLAVAQEVSDQLAR
jgi:aspartyl-tRNA(Asn)/glutamyl-tRNA(Gln) amidotransferase subunit A